MLLTLTLVSLSAQDSLCRLVLRGKVIDSSEQTPLQHTLVVAEAYKQLKSNTDKTGTFELSGLCPGEIELHISHLQCEHIHLKINLKSDTFVIVYLKHSEQELEGVKLTVKQQRSENLNISRYRSLEWRKGSGISQMMQDIGGVSLLKTGSNVSKPMVNGLYGNRVIIVNNGIRQEGQNWGMEHAPEMDAFLASEIELLKGAESLRYGGDGIGGIILVKSKSLFAEKAGLLSGEGNAMGFLNGRGAALNASIGSQMAGKLPVFWRIQGTLKQSGNSRTAHDYLANTGMQEQNYSANLGIKKGALQSELFFSEFFNRIGIYAGAQVGNLSDLQRAMNSDRPLIQSGFTYATDRPYQWVRHRLLKSRTVLTLNARNVVELSISYQKNKRQEFDVLRSATAFQGPSFDYYINTTMGELIWIRNDFHHINFKAGLYGLRQSNAYNGRFFIPGFYQNSMAPFFIAKRSFRKWSFETALRYDYRHFKLFLWQNGISDVRQNRYHGPAYVLQAAYKLNKNGRITFLHSGTWRPPAPNELYANGLHQGLASLEIGDPDLKRETAYSQSVSYQHQTEILNLETEAYYQIIRGFINLIPGSAAQLTIRGAYPVFNYTQSDAALYGLNFKVKRKVIRSFFAHLQGSFPFGKNLSTKTPLNLMPPVSGKLSLSWEQKPFQAVLWTQATARQFRYTENSDFLPPPPAYLLAGFDLEWQTKIGSQPMRFNMSIHNLSNTAYRDYLNRFRYFTDEPGFNLTLRLIVPLQITTKSNHHEKTTH